MLGFSYFDVMARLKTHGPDDAWKRLREIIEWFGDVQREGGYRAYYAKPGRGTLQGGGPAGGLGLDQEFLESVLVPQVLLYGFLGLRPTAEGMVLKPQLPADWPELSIEGIHLHGHVLNITARRQQVQIDVRSTDGRKLQLVLERQGQRKVERLQFQPGATLRIEM